MNDTHENQSIIWQVVYTIFILGLLCAFIFVIYKNTQKPSSGSITTPVVLETITTDQSQWKSHTITDANIAFKAPPEFAVTSKTEKDAATGQPYVITLNVQHETYHLSGIYQLDADYDHENLEAFKGQLLPESVKDTTISGLPAIVGQTSDEHKRYVIYIQTDKGVLSLLTSEPTEANKKITDAILSTFVFTNNE